MSKTEVSEEWIQIAKWKPLDEIKVLSADGGTSLTFPEGNLLWIDTSDPEKHVLKMRVEISDEKRPGWLLVRAAEEQRKLREENAALKKRVAELENLLVNHWPGFECEEGKACCDCEVCYQCRSIVSRRAGGGG